MANVATLTATLKADTSQFSAGMKAAATQASDLGRSMSALGSTLTRKATLPIVGMGVAAIKMSVDFNTAMSRIEGLVGVAHEEVEGMKGAVLGLAGATAKAPTELAEAMFSIQSAGIKGAAAMETLEIAAKAATGGLGNTQDIALASASAMNAYGQANLSATQATDILTATVKEGNLAAAELASSVGKVIPIAAAAGLEFEQVGAAVALITRSGATASEAITQVQAAIKAIIAPNRVAKKLLDEAGLSMEKLQSTIRDDGLLAALKMIQEAAGNNAGTMARMLGSSEALSGALTLLNGDAAETARVFDSVANSTGSAQKAFDVAAQQDGFKFAQAMTEVKIALISIGDIIAPVFAKVASGIAAAVRWFDDLGEGTKKTIVVLAGLAALAGPLLNLAGALLRIPAAMMKMSAALLALNPLVLAFAAAVAGVAAIAVGAWLKQRAWNEGVKEARQRLEELNPELDGAARRLRDIADALEESEDTFDGLADVLTETAGASLVFERAISAGLGPQLEALVDAGFDLDQIMKHSSQELSNFADFLDAVADSGAFTERIMMEYAQKGIGGLIAQTQTAVTEGRIQIDQLRDLSGTIADTAKQVEEATKASKNEARALFESADAYDILTKRMGFTSEAALTYVNRAIEAGDATGDFRPQAVQLEKDLEAVELALAFAAAEFADFDEAIVMTDDDVVPLIQDMEALTKAFADIYDPAKAVEAAFKDGAVSAKAFREEMANQRQAAVDAARNLQVLIDEGLGPLGEHLMSLGPSGQAMMDELVQGIKNGDTDLLDEWERTWTEMQVIATGNVDAIALLGDSEFAETIQRFTTSGVRMGEGLINGILSMEDAIELAAIQVGNKAASGLDWAIEVMSPSRRTARSGQYFGQGFVDGITSMSDKVNAAGGSLGDKAAKALREGWEEASRDLKDALKVEGFEQQIRDIYQSVVDAADDVQDAYHKAVDANQAVYQAELDVIAAKKEAVIVTDEEMRAIAAQVRTVDDLKRSYELAVAEVDAMLASQRALTDMSLSSALSQAGLELQIFRTNGRIGKLTAEIDEASKKGEDFTEAALELRLEQLRLEEQTAKLSVVNQTATTHAEELGAAFGAQMRAAQDVKLAEDELAALRAAATGDTDAVRQAEENLRQARYDAMIANQDYNAATAALGEAQLDLQTDLIKVMLSIGDFIAQGGQWRSDLNLSGVATGALSTTAVNNFASMQAGGSAQMQTLKNNIATQMGAAQIAVGNAVGNMSSAINGLPTQKTFNYKIVTDTKDFQHVQGVTSGGHQFQYYGSPQFPARAAGGPVSGGRPYLVGERGPEVVVPGQSGTVIPNHALGGASVNVTINAGNIGSEAQLRDWTIDAVRQALRLNPGSLS
jgi:TP901 family phage tail tape measure protein